MICRKTLEGCKTPSMCAPFGGCSDPRDVDCSHDWKEVESQSENTVKCWKCSVYGERQRDGSVFWPAT